LFAQFSKHALECESYMAKDDADRSSFARRQKGALDADAAEE